MGSHGHSNGGKVLVKWMNSETISQADSHGWTEGQVDRWSGQLATIIKWTDTWNCQAQGLQRFEEWPV